MWKVQAVDMVCGKYFRQVYPSLISSCSPFRPIFSFTFIILLSLPPSLPFNSFPSFLPSFLPSVGLSGCLYFGQASDYQSISPFVHSSFLLYQLNLISPPVPYSVLPFITSFFNASFLPPFIPPSSLIT